MLVFITGVSTSGKSTIARRLSERGYRAYDLEHHGISAWFDKRTGARDAEFGQVPERTKEWMDAHEWRVSIDRVKDIAKEAGDRPVFLCGGGANEKDIIALCDTVIFLRTDEKTIRQRVVVPRDHTYGTRPHELAAIIDSNAQKEQEYERLGAIMIDARQALDNVVEDVLSRLTKNK